MRPAAFSSPAWWRISFNLATGVPAKPGKRPGFDRSPPLVNPIAGPVYIEGAERGDTLAVTIESITVEPFSWIAVGPRRGPLGESSRFPDC